jgi:zinc protease
MSALLWRGSSARLSQRLVGGTQLARFAQTGRDGRRHATVFWAAAAPRSAADSAAVEHELIAEIERLATEPVSGEELDRARRQLEVGLLLARQSARDRGQVLGASSMLTGDQSDADRQLDRLRTLTPADLQKAASRTLVASRRAVVWETPAPAGTESGVGQ